MKLCFYIIVSILVFSCSQNSKQEIYVQDKILGDAIVTIDSPMLADTIKIIWEDTISDLEKILRNSGLVNVQGVDTSIMVNLKYSGTDNFMGLDLYGKLNNAYLQLDVVEKLVKAQSFLKVTNPDLTLLIYDAVRPRHIQQIMWDTLELPINEKVKFVSNPKKGSLHNFGAAVDITLARLDGNVLDMGTDFDYIGELAYPILEQKFLDEGKLSIDQVANRKLLRKVMYQAGFFNIQTEWWHFNSCYRNEALKKYVLIE